MKEFISRIKHIIGNIVLSLILGGALFGLWRILPKPKEPPSADDIADAVKKKLTNTQDILSAAKTRSPLGTENPGQHPKRSTPAQPKNQPPAIPATPQQAHLSVSQFLKISSRLDAPFETEVIVQTDIVFSSLKFVMQCDKPLIEAQPTINGAVQMGVSSGVVPDHPNVVVYSYNYSAPPFGPANPLVIDIWSKEPPNCKQVTTF